MYLNDDNISRFNESGKGRHTLICIQIDQVRYGYTHSMTCLRMPSVKNPDQYKQVHMRVCPDSIRDWVGPRDYAVGTEL